MGKPRDTKIAILPSTTRKGTTLSTSAALDSPSVIDKLVSPPHASHAGTSAESENSHNIDNVSAVLDDSGSLGSFLDATIAKSRQIENTETPNATTPVKSPELEYSSDDLDEDYVELDDDFIEKCNATTDARKIKKLLAEHAVRYKPSPDPKFATSPINIRDKDYDFSLDLSHIAIVEKTPFCGTEKESAVEHMTELSTLSGVFSDDVKMRTYFVAKIFPFSLKDDAKTWYNNLPPGSIKSPIDLRDVFFRKYFPASAQHAALQRIYNFDQEDGEKLPEAWARFCSLIRAQPDHDLEKHDLLDIFYSGLTIESRAYLDSCAGCVFRKRTPDDAEELLAKIGRNHDDWSTPEPTPTPIVKKRGMIKLNDEDMREAKKSLKEKGIKPEDVKNLPPIEDICETIPPSSMIEYMKDIVTNKRKVPNEEISTMLANYSFNGKIPKKLGDPDKLIPTDISLQMADKSTAIPVGLCENVPVQVTQHCLILTDFVVLEMPEDDNMSIILGRPFLNTAGAVIDCNKGMVTFNVDDKEHTVYFPKRIDKDFKFNWSRSDPTVQYKIYNKAVNLPFSVFCAAIGVPQWGSCEKIRGTPRELSDLYTRICNGRSLSNDGESRKSAGSDEKEDVSEATASAQSPPPAVSPRNKRKRDDAEDSGTSKVEEAVPSHQKAGYDPYLEALISSDDEEEVPTADVAARTSTSHTLVASETPVEGEETSPPRQNVGAATPPSSPLVPSPKRARVETIPELTLQSSSSSNPLLDDPMIKELLRIGAQFVGYRDYASKTEEKLAEANERADTLAQKLEQCEEARKKAESDAVEARQEADKAKADAAGVEDLRKRLHDAETSLSEHITAQSAREAAITKRIRTQNRRFVNRTSQEFELENPDNDSLLDAVSFLEFHGTEAREGMDEARAGLSKLFPYFFPKKEEPATFLGLAKCFNPPEDLGLKMRHENMKVAVESTVALVADSQQTIDWAKVGDTEQIEQTKWRSLIKAAKLNTKKILAYLGIKPSSTPSSSRPEV
ncbi:hypothetical protein QYE76_030633 [Lolium multiflorum]|uniref:Retrotransposon gag domain-containing protein n=1 Tax=Lolium multiflorum TaxID=4521 RepID=A0AAD8QQ71_LOLMU|nr:hypothetical protein QYE76_030633 [Lolium multiflorum]